MKLMNASSILMLISNEYLEYRFKQIGDTNTKLSLLLLLYIFIHYSYIFVLFSSFLQNMSIIKNALFT